MSPKLVTIYGATGNQGGSVARSLLADESGAFAVRGTTRKPDSESAKALSAAGAEVVRADGKVKEQLVAAFEGSWGVFANTNSDDPVRVSQSSVRDECALTRCSRRSVFRALPARPTLEGLSLTRLLRRESRSSYSAAWSRLRR